ncbi:MAG: hypothetical protein L0Y72_32010 [Gemmataceae bacterium]|nr:hypothetical protein [Gemmataceae bacterium]
MATIPTVRGEPVPWSIGGRELVRWVCTQNPFYIISAGLFLVGLWISFGGTGRDVDNWALMGGLGGYTLLLAGATFLLVRFAKVWDDVRTVLLLVVLMFLATSVTFDETFAIDPGRGWIFYVVGLAFAALVSEGVLRGIRLRLPARFRVPYYLILSLFFLYPLALSPLLDAPRSEGLMWGLFGFSTVAGLVFLTLLPAIRRGPDYVRDNGSPWPWPLYPWSLFFFLGLAVLGRAFLLCWSMHLLSGQDRDQLIFGPYFLVPFGLCVGVLLLEIGLSIQKRTQQSINGVLTAALVLPIALVGLTLFGHRNDALYREFLDEFAGRLGGDPLHLALFAAAGFYVYAAARRVRFATEALTAALVLLSVAGPNTMLGRELVSPQAAPLVVAAVLQLALGLWQRSSWRCLLGASLAILATGTVHIGAGYDPLRGLVAFHIVLGVMWLVGALFSDWWASRLRQAAALLAAFAGLGAIVVSFNGPAGFPPWAVQGYPFMMAIALALYGWWMAHRFSHGAAAFVLAAWLGGAILRGYIALRQVVTGLDYLAGSLVVLAVAVLISLGKAGVLSRWLETRRSDSTG